MSDKIDLFSMLTLIDTKNINWYDELSDTDKKTVSPVLLMQWLTCSKNEFQTIIVNEILNKYVFSLHKHPKLLCKLMTVCTPGKKQYYKWNKPKRTKHSYPKTIELLKKYNNDSTREVIKYLHLIDNSEILMIAYSMGLQQDAIKAIQTEIKDR